MAKKNKPIKKYVCTKETACMGKVFKPGDTYRGTEQPNSHFKEVKK